MAIAITLAIIALVASYGAARPNELWFQHYAGKFAQAREVRPGEPEFAFRRRTYLIVAAVCWLLALVTAVALWRGAQPPGPS